MWSIPWSNRHRSSPRMPMRKRLKNGKVRAGTKTKKFAKMANMPVHLRLSGNTMEFDASGKCVNGCLAALN